MCWRLVYACIRRFVCSCVHPGIVYQWVARSRILAKVPRLGNRPGNRIPKSSTLSAQEWSIRHKVHGRVGDFGAECSEALIPLAGTGRRHLYRMCHRGGVRGLAGGCAHLATGGHVVRGSFSCGERISKLHPANSELRLMFRAARQVVFSLSDSLNR